MDNQFSTKRLERIQTQLNLNEVYCDDLPHKVNKAHHVYSINMGGIGITIQFQNGARHEEGSKRGVLDTDLLEIVRHRLTSFQDGDYACEENQRALEAVEEALHALNDRVLKRIKERKLGTSKI